MCHEIFMFFPSWSLCMQTHICNCSRHHISTVICTVLAYGIFSPLHCPGISSVLYTVLAYPQSSTLSWHTLSPLHCPGILSVLCTVLAYSHSSALSWHSLSPLHCPGISSVHCTVLPYSHSSALAWQPSVLCPVLESPQTSDLCIFDIIKEPR